MNLLQKQYGLKINIQKDSQRYNIENYFNTIEAIRSRPTQFITYPKNCFIKKISQEPYKDIFVIQSNRKMRLRLESIRNKPVIPKINNDCKLNKSTSTEDIPNLKFLNETYDKFSHTTANSEKKIEQIFMKKLENKLYELNNKYG